MTKQMKVIIKGVIYIISDEKCKLVLELGKKYAAEHTIYALETKEVVEMINKSYKSIQSLKRAITRFEDNGFKVYYKL